MSFISKKEVDAWDAEYSHVTWGGVLESSWIQKNLPKNAFLLDAGSGTGRYLKEFFFNYPCIGIDLSKNALLRSLQDLGNAAEKKGCFSFPDHLVSNITDLPFEKSCFDGILCLGVLQHLRFSDRLKTVFEFYRVLKTGGCVYFESFGESDMRCSTDFFPTENSEERTFLRQNGLIYHYFNEEELKELFEEAGFITKEIQSLKKEKKYDGKSYIRHHYRAVFEK